MSDNKTNYGVGMTLIMGEKPSPERLQRVGAIAHAFDIPHTDPMMAIIAAFECYYGAFSQFPKEITERITKAADEAANSAAVQAKAQITEAVAALVPSVERAVGNAAATTVKRLQIGRSIFTIWAGLCVLGLVFGFGWLAGSHVFSSLQNHVISLGTFWEETGWGIGVGIVSLGLMVFGLTYYLSDTQHDAKLKQIQLIMAGVGFLGFLALVLHQVGLMGNL